MDLKKMVLLKNLHTEKAELVKKAKEIERLSVFYSKVDIARENIESQIMKSVACGKDAVSIDREFYEVWGCNRYASTIVGDAQRLLEMIDSKDSMEAYIVNDRNPTSLAYSYVLATLMATPYFKVKPVIDSFFNIYWDYKSLAEATENISPKKFSAEIKEYESKLKKLKALNQKAKEILES